MIFFDAASESNGDGTDAGVEPFSHTTANQEGRIILVAIAYDNLTDLLVGATYNGVALTQLERITISATRLWVGYLVAPDVGTNDVNFSWSPSAATVFRACALTFYGVYQANAIGQFVKETGENAIPTEFATDITPDGVRGMLLDFYAGSRAQAGNATAPQNEVINITGNWSGGANFLLGASYLAHSGSTTTFEWENLTHDSSAADQFHSVIELREPPVAQVMGAQII